MSAVEVIRLIEALPPEERSLVVDFVKTLDAEPSSGAVRYIDREKFEAAKNRVFEEHADLLKKLAQ